MDGTKDGGAEDEDQLEKWRQIRGDDESIQSIPRKGTWLSHANIYTCSTALTTHASTSMLLPERLLLMPTSFSTIGVGIHSSLCEICISELCDSVVSQRSSAPSGVGGDIGGGARGGMDGYDVLLQQF